MTDKILIEMSRQIGQLIGTVSTLKDAQEATNASVSDLLTKHDDRISSLEKTETKALTLAAVVGLVASFVPEFFVNMFKGHS